MCSDDDFVPGHLFVFACGVSIKWDSCRYFARLRMELSRFLCRAATGKELYASGSEITTYAHMSGVSVGDAHAFFTTHDGTLYSFGIGIEH